MRYLVFLHDIAYEGVFPHSGTTGALLHRIPFPQRVFSIRGEGMPEDAIFLEDYRSEDTVVRTGRVYQKESKRRLWREYGVAGETTHGQLFCATTEYRQISPQETDVLFIGGSSTQYHIIDIETTVLGEALVTLRKQGEPENSDNPRNGIPAESLDEILGTIQKQPDAIGHWLKERI